MNSHRHISPNSHSRPSITSKANPALMPTSQGRRLPRPSGPLDGHGMLLVTSTIRNRVSEVPAHVTVCHPKSCISISSCHHQRHRVTADEFSCVVWLPKAIPANENLLAFSRLILSKAHLHAVPWTKRNMGRVQCHRSRS